MKHKVSELEGAELDAAVAKCEGYELDEYGDNRTIRENGGAPSAWHPSTDWLKGGGIIERERIWIFAPSEKNEDETPPGWGASIGCFFWNRGEVSGDGEAVHANGPTPLIAAMRAFVASRFGEEVEL